MHSLITAARESDSVLRVNDTVPRLPTDIATLQELLAQARAERDTALAERDHLQSQNDRLQDRLRFALDLVRSTKTKGSIKTRRKRAGWSLEFLLQVLQITR